MSPTESSDDHWMKRCLELATRGAGRVSPNPLVGAVLVAADGTVLGEGYHERFGGPHAEPNAIRAAENAVGLDALRAATLYVNLEPCSHHGKTPPCADLIIRKGIPRVVVGMIDPFPQVAGEGMRRLRAAGLEVRTGVLESACHRLNEAFVHHVETGRPLVLLKIAQTLDGRVASATGDSRWVSGEASRKLVHQWRSEVDAVLVGAATAERDDPALTVRTHAGRQPTRVVLDRDGSLSPALKLFSDAFAAHTIAVVSESVRPTYEEALSDKGGRVRRLPLREGRMDLNAVLEMLGREGGSEHRPAQSLLVEAGPRLATSFVRSDLVDRLLLFIAPKIIGDGPSAVTLPGTDLMADARRFAGHTWTPVGDDILFTGFRRSFHDDGSES